MEGKRSKKKVIIIFLTAAVLCIAVSLAAVFGPEFLKGEVLLGTKDENGEHFIKFINVGAADCMLIKSRGNTALIDFGDIKDGGDAVIRSLRKSGVESVDFGFISHPHMDHIGGAPAVIEEFSIGTMVMPPLSEFMRSDSETAISVYETIADNCEYKTLKANDSYKVGEFTVEIIYYNTEFDDINDCSAVFKVSAFGKSLLTGGDMGPSTEDDLLMTGCDISADIFKLSHHGSDYSNDFLFVELTGAEYVVVSSEYDEDFDAKFDILKSVNEKVKVYRTDKNGDISFYFDGGSLKCVTEK